MDANIFYRWMRFKSGVCAVSSFHPTVMFVGQWFSGLKTIVEPRFQICRGYDPTQGYQVLTIREFGLANGSTLFLDADKNNVTTNSRFSAFPYDWNQGLVTGFNDSVSAVPEPSTWAMLILGFAGVGFRLIVAATTQRLTQPDLGPDRSQAKLES